MLRRRAISALIAISAAACARSNDSGSAAGTSAGSTVPFAASATPPDKGDKSAPGSSPAVIDFVGGFDGRLHAYDKQDGRRLWATYVGGRILGAPVLVGPLVFFSTLEQKTYAARASDGRIVWRLGIGKYSPGIATERMYYFTLNGLLVAFPGKDGPRPARASSGSAPKTSKHAPRKQPPGKR